MQHYYPKLKAPGVIGAIFLILTVLFLTHEIASAAQPVNNQTSPAIKEKYYRIVLSGDRMCKKCTYHVFQGKDGQRMVRLTDKKARSGVYPAREIRGIDSHPGWRWFAHAVAQRKGIAGETIVPEAFEYKDLDGNPAKNLHPLW